MSYLQISGVPRTPWAEEALVIPVIGTVVTLDATKADGSLMVRGRLEGGPIRAQFLTPPTSTAGTPIYDADVVEWTSPELDALVATGGFVAASTATLDATLYLTYYR